MKPHFLGPFRLQVGGVSAISWGDGKFKTNQKNTDKPYIFVIPKKMKPFFFFKLLQQILLFYFLGDRYKLS
jgi:hypothetical protein